MTQDSFDLTRFFPNVSQEWNKIGTPIWRKNLSLYSKEAGIKYDTRLLRPDKIINRFITRLTQDWRRWWCHFLYPFWDFNNSGKNKWKWNNISKIVATHFYASSKGQCTHSAWTKIYLFQFEDSTIKPSWTMLLLGSTLSLSQPSHTPFSS